MDQHVPSGVRGADLDQVDPLVANRERELSREGPRYGRQLDVAEVEGPEDLPEEGARLAELIGVVEHRCHHLRRDLRELLGGRLGRDDGGVSHELVPVAVVSIGVRIHERVDRTSCRRCIAHGLEHLGGELQVEERVDEQGLAAVRDQPGVAPAPGAVRL